MNKSLWRHVASARTSFQWLLALCLAGLALGAAAQTNSIESVTTNQQGGSVIVRINLKNAPAEAPASFSINNPARIAIDFAKTDNNVGKSSIDANQGDLRSLNVVQAGDRSRIVLNLKRAVQFKTAVDGNAVIVTLDNQVGGISSPAGPGPSAPVAVSVAARFAESGAGTHSLRDIDFRRGPDGEGRIVVDLADNQTGIDIRAQGQSVVVDFLRTRLPDSLRRRLNVVDFGTPVQNINTFVQGDNVRMVIEPRGNWEHSAYQSDTQLVIEVKALKEDPNRLVQGTTKLAYKGEKLSLNFQNVEVRSLLQVIADFTNMNIITSDTVGGNVTLRLKDVPWDQALDIIMQSKNLDLRRNGNVVLIAPRDELATKEKLELEARSQLSALEPTRTEVFQLNYSRADTFRTVLEDPGARRILSARGRSVIDVRTNQIFVTDTPSKIDELRQLILLTDIPSRQVLIEARIVEADDQFSRNLGVKLGYTDLRYQTFGKPSGNGLNGSISGNYAGVGETTLQTPLSGASYVPNTQFFSLPAGGLNGVNPASIAISLFRSGMTRFLNLELSALEADGKGKIISSPRIVTADKVKALIEQGTELPYEVATSSGATSIAFRKANLKLEVTPQITPEGAIILDVDVNKDTVGRETRAGFAIDTKHIQTKVQVENGGTVVIGGIFQQTERNTTTKVPVFGDLPGIGNLFRSNQRSDDKTEMLVFITPKVINERVNVR